MKTVWAVNYASELDWECLRDDGYESVEAIAAVNCLPQLFATCQEALDEGQRQWENDRDYNEGYGPDEDGFEPVFPAVPEIGPAQRTLRNAKGDFVVLISARELKLPVWP